MLFSSEEKTLAYAAEREAEQPVLKEGERLAVRIRPDRYRLRWEFPDFQVEIKYLGTKEPIHLYCIRARGLDSPRRDEAGPWATSPLEAVNLTEAECKKKLKEAYGTLTLIENFKLKRKTQKDDADVGSQGREGIDPPNRDSQ